MHKRPVVAIVGRPNVGKSTLFNRLVGERRAVVHPQPGMTRDRHYSDAIYRMRPFTVIDTGGYEASTESTLLSQMRMQSMVAMDEADVVIFLTSVREPQDSIDEEILDRLRASGRPFYLVVNKCESRMADAEAYAEFSRFGVDVYPISARDGHGVYDLMDAVTEWFEEWDPDDVEKEDASTIRVAIVGRQNVGKSSLLNRLLGQERVIANPLAGTTRDAIDAEITVDGKPYVVIDTAGIRRRGKIEKGPEKLSVHSSFAAIDRAHVVLLVIDASEGITAQDTHVAGYIFERRRACILVLNKWDILEDREKMYKQRLEETREHFNFMPWAPILTVSAKTGQRTAKIWNLVQHCAENYGRKFKTSKLNLIVRQATAYLSPPTRKNKTLKIKYVTQTGTMPPVISLFVNDPTLVHFSYRRFLTNQFYRALGLEGTPLVLRFREKSPPRGWERRVTVPTDSAVEALETGRFSDGTFFAGVYNEDGEYAQEIDLSEVPDLDEATLGKMFGDGPDDDDDDVIEDEDE